MLERHQIHERLLTVLKDNTSIEGELPQLNEDSNLPETLGLDSMDTISLAMAVEDAFKIRIDIDELVEGGQVTLKRLVDLIISQASNPPRGSPEAS